MMYDELIQNLRKMENSECCAIASAEDFPAMQFIKQAADAIEDLQKQLQKSEVDNINLTGWLAEEHAKHLWIPVTERLPEKHNRVLVYSKATRMGRSIDFINSDGNWYTTPKVTHWMPLPSTEGLNGR